MPRLTRLYRRPVVILAGLYLAGVGLFAWLLPYRPAMLAPRGDFHQMLIGFSPDGDRLATSVSVMRFLPGADDQEWPEDPLQIWRIDAGQPTRVEPRPGIDVRRLARFVVSPAARPLVWRY